MLSRISGIGKSFLISVFIVFACFGASAFGEIRSFTLESHYAVPGGEVAEIIAPTPEGLYLFYTNASGKKFGVLDISNPKKPIERASVSVGEGEPTSLAITADGRHLVVVRRNGDDFERAIPGTLLVYNIEDRTKPRLAGELALGIGPDSVALAQQGDKTVAVIAIEDEESDKNGDAALPGKRPGRVDVVTLNFNDVARSSLASVEFHESLLSSVSGVNFTSDPQPEYVAIHPNQREAAVTLQENNAVALIDITDSLRPVIKHIFCAGTAERKADIKKDGSVKFVDDFKGRREPDGITYIKTGSGVFLALANEGDTSVKTFGDGVQSGGRGVSIHSTSGKVLRDSGVELDIRASLLGHYPDDRSDKRGTEIEGVAFANFNGDPLLIASSERGSFMAVYRVQDPTKPMLLAILPTGIGPEGVVAVEGRKDGKKLLVSANEKDGTINIYSASESDVKASSKSPRLFSTSIPFGAISGFATDGKFIYAVPDNAWNPSRIWRLNMDSVRNGTIEIDREIVVTKGDKPIAYDLEGICWTADGFWLASEGKVGAENLLIFATHDGKVREEYPLSAELLKRYGDPKNFGFEGVAVSGKYVYTAVQRGFDTSKSQAAILRFDTVNKTWDAAFYPLERHSKDAKKFWMGLSDITFLNDKTLLVVERDKGMGGTAEVKRIYAVDISTFTPDGMLKKRLVRDILKERGMLLEKVESLTVFGGNLWIANDNDGAGWTQVLNLGRAGR